MKRVAIIGCSHSDYSLRPHNWVRFCAQDFPDLHFDVYALGGHGHIYMDIVLKDIWDTYDHYIVQLTQPTRWMLGFQGELSTPAYIRYDTDRPNISDWKFNIPRVAMLGSSQLNNQKALSEYYPDWQFHLTHKEQTHGGTWYNDVPGDDSTRVILKFQNNINPLAYHFSRAFARNLRTYGNRISYFNHGTRHLNQRMAKVDHWKDSDGNTNNINQSLDVFTHLETNHYDDFLSYIDETNHLNLAGSECLWNSYLLPSTLGERLKKL